MKSILLQIGIIILCTNFVCAKHIIRGTVIDKSTRNPVAGASIVVVGTQRNQLTNSQGKFSLAVVDSCVTLRCTKVGYAPLTIANVSAKDTIIVELNQQFSIMSKNSIISECPRAIIHSTAEISHYAEYCAAPSATYYNPSIETYSKINENGFRDARGNPLSTFSIDVDRASYSNVRRYIGYGNRPPRDAVKIEELINYFDYDYPSPTGSHPYSIETELSQCPWEARHQLLRIALQAKRIPTENLPPSNLVFLIDVSGSMQAPNKLPLIIQAFKMLVNNLRSQDRVAIVVYASREGLLLPSTPGDRKNTIIRAIDELEAGGSTSGAAGLRLAYQVASENFIHGGNNRIILATDGDFNVGISNENDLQRFIEEKRNTGVYLSCLGFGMGNYKDSKLEILADKGNGNHAYIDDIQEARKVLVNEFGSTLFTVAKDVKIQVEFNPAVVQAYRLVGYENRLLNPEDFKDDKKDAGEMGAGHTVTVLYEIIPVGVKSPFVKKVDSLKYQQQKLVSSGDEIATVKSRYKKPDGEISIEMIQPIPNRGKEFQTVSQNTRFAAAVAMFGMILRDSEFKGTSSFDDIISIAKSARGEDPEEYRSEFIRLVKTVKDLPLAKEKD